MGNDREGLLAVSSVGPQTAFALSTDPCEGDALPSNPLIRTMAESLVPGEPDAAALPISPISARQNKSWHLHVSVNLGDGRRAPCPMTHPVPEPPRSAAPARSSACACRPKPALCWNRKANAAGLSESALIRALIEDAPIVSAAEQTARQQTNAQLARIGNNLNQLARHANSWRGNADAAFLAAEVAAIRAELRAILTPRPRRGKADADQVPQAHRRRADGQPGDPDARLAIDYLQGRDGAEARTRRRPLVWIRRATAPIPISAMPG